MLHSALFDTKLQVLSGFIIFGLIFESDHTIHNFNVFLNQINKL
jgi:hypothetical protein